MRIKARLREFWHEEDGQDLIEYALLASTLSLAAVASLASIGLTVSGSYGVLETNVNDAFGF